MVNLKEDLATLTTIPTRSIDKLFSKSSLCIANAVTEGVLEGQDVVEINIGFGTLKIAKTEQGIRYLFKPSADLEESVRDAFLGKRNKLTDVVEAALVDRIVNTYKDLI